MLERDRSGILQITYAIYMFDSYVKGNIMAGGRNPNEGKSKRRGLRRSTEEAADWGSVDANYIRSAIATAARTGGALRFGYTSDGGAFALGIYGDGDIPYTEFIGPSDSVENVLEEVIALYEAIWAEQGKAKAS